MFIARLIAQRFLLALFTLLLVSFLIFAVLEILPGDVATRILGRDATPETLAALRDRMHLGDPNLERIAFGLQEGEISEVMAVNNQFAILKCEKQIPPRKYQLVDSLE